MKKLLLAGVAAVAFAAPAHAQDAMDSPLTGFYVGALGGYSMTDVDTSIGDADVDGADYGAFVGLKLDKYLENSIGINGAIEAHYVWSNADESIGALELEKENEWGVSFRPGISISESINPYGIIGYKRAEFSANGAGFTGEESYDGFELGIGTELVAYGDYGVRIDYSHTWYGEEDGIDLDEDTIRAGVAYHF